MSTLKVDTVQSTGGSTIFTHSSGLFKPNALICQVKGINVDQDYSTSTYPTIQFNSVDIDTGSFWDSTNHRYTPTVAGWYYVSGVVRFTADSVPVGWVFISARKNGTNVAVYQWQGNSDYISHSMLPIPSTLIQLNGSGDYIDAMASMEEAGTISDHGTYPSVLTIQLVHAT